MNNSDIILNGDEKFTFNGNDLEMTILDYWKWTYSEIYDLQDSIAEFIVAKALGMEKAHNVGIWTLYDINYHGVRIEVKETSYYHAWQKDGDKISKARNFDIQKRNSNYENKNEENKFERQNDIYVFCLNTGFNREESNPMRLENWEFYVVPTKKINEECGDNKTISLNKIKSLINNSYVDYNHLKERIDNVIKDK